MLLEEERTSRAAIIEVKYAHDGDFDGALRLGLSQIELGHYEEGLSPLSHVRKVVIAFDKKRCKVEVR